MPGERLDETVMAMVVARDFPDGAVVNLGVGLPLTCAVELPHDREILLHSEHGLLGFGPVARDRAHVDPLVSQVGNQPVEARPGMVFMSHEESFALVRGGHVDITVLGALEVDAQGNLANAQLPGKVAGNLGGGPDLAVRAKRCVVLMHHTTPDGTPKLVERCTLPLTAPRCVDRVVTDVAVIDVRDGTFVLREVAPGWTPADVQAITAAPLVIADDVREITLG